MVDPKCFETTGYNLSLANIRLFKIEETKEYVSCLEIIIYYYFIFSYSDSKQKKFEKAVCVALSISCNFTEVLWKYEPQVYCTAQNTTFLHALPTNVKAHCQNWDHC